MFGLTNQYEAMLVLAKKELKQMQTMLEQVQQVRCNQFVPQLHTQQAARMLASCKGIELFVKIWTASR